MYEGLKLSGIETLLKSAVLKESIDIGVLEDGQMVSIKDLSDFKTLSQYAAGHITEKGLRVLYDHMTAKFSEDESRRAEDGGILMNRWDINTWQQNKCCSPEQQQRLERDPDGVKVHGSSWLRASY